MQEYWRRYVECPFYRTNNICMVHCEAGKIYFDTQDATKNMLDSNCVSNYRDCPIYINKMIDYDLKEREERERAYKARNGSTA